MDFLLFGGPKCPCDQKKRCDDLDEATQTLLQSSWTNSWLPERIAGDPVASPSNMVEVLHHRDHGTLVVSTRKNAVGDI